MTLNEIGTNKMKHIIELYKDSDIVGILAVDESTWAKFKCIDYIDLDNESIYIEQFGALVQEIFNTARAELNF